MSHRVYRPPIAVAPRSRNRRNTRWGLIALAPLAFTGCVSYEPAPLDPAGILSGLRAVSLDAPRAPDKDSQQSSEQGGEASLAPPPFDPSDGLTMDEAAAVAVTLNPALRVSRAEAGVAESQLVEAGLLPDPTVGWDIADSDLEVLLPLLRPNERDAKVDEAQARVNEVQWAIHGDEWTLKRDVQLAFIDLLATVEQRLLNDQLQEVVTRTRDFFLRARGQGAATALQETTAAIQAAEVRLEGEGLVVQERRARQALNALLGLPPEAQYLLQTPINPFHERSEGLDDAGALTQQALEHRPDLQALLATYEQAEQRLHLAVAQQWPALTIGTSLELQLPFFSGFNGPAIQTATKEREQLGQAVEAAVHQLRAEVHDALAALELARRQVEYFENEIEPRLAESLNLVDEAFQARQVTAGEILIAQSQVLDARERLLASRIAHARALAVVTWVTGDKTPGGEP